MIRSSITLRRQILNHTLKTKLIAWRQELSSAADLHVGPIGRKYPMSIYRHGQHVESKVVVMSSGDDFHSPVNPEDYIRLRLTPIRRFYQKRIPRYDKRRLLVQITLLLLTALSAFLSRYNILFWVVVSSVTSQPSQPNSQSHMIPQSRYRQIVPGSHADADGAELVCGSGLTGRHRFRFGPHRIRCVGGDQTRCSSSAFAVHSCC